MMDSPNSNRPGLLITTSAFPRREGEERDTFIRDLCLGLLGDFELTVLVPRDKGFPREEHYQGLHILKHAQSPFNLLRIAYGSGIMQNIRKNPLLLPVLPFYFLFQWMRLKSIVKKKNISIINAHWIIPQGLIAVWYKRVFNHKIKVITTVHGTDLHAWSRGLMSRLQNYVFRHSDAIITVSPSMKEMIEARGYGSKCYSRSMGVNTDMFSPSASNPRSAGLVHNHKPVLLFVGSLIEPKGIRVLLEAMPEVCAVFRDMLLVVVGDGILMHEMKNLCKDLSIEKNVVFTGALPHAELAGFYTNCDLFVLPSFSEGFGLVVAEAMACGARVLVSDLPATRTLVQHAENGLLAPVGDSGALSQMIIEILADTNNTGNIRNSARDLICEKYSWPVVCREYADILSKYNQ
jgi:glycosyltransferase involved in cell wall biosynthesis